MIIDSERNQAAYLQLVELTRSGRALAFIGAGVSCSLGYPSWDRLIERLAAEHRALTGEQIQSNGQVITVEQVLRDLRDEPLVQGQILKQNLGDKYFQVMTELFGPKESLIAPIFDLVALPFKHLLTSNYDPGLEQHHKPENRPMSICLHHHSAPQFITNFVDDNYARRIVHVHGRYDEPREIILTEEDYGSYVCSAVLQRFWEVIPVAGRLVFFGFSFKDIDLLYSFRRVRMALGGNDQDQPRHYAVLPIDDPAAEKTTTLRIKMKYGVEPIFFLQKGNSFAEYDDLLSRLNADVSGKGPQQLLWQRVAPMGSAAQLQPAVAQPTMPITREAAIAVQQGVDRLRQMTRENIARRQTGDLE